MKRVARESSTFFFVLKMLMGAHFLKKSCIFAVGKLLNGQWTGTEAWIKKFVLLMFFNSNNLHISEIIRIFASLNK